MQLLPSKQSLLLWERSGEERFHCWRCSILNRSAAVGNGVQEDKGDRPAGRRQQEQYSEDANSLRKSLRNRIVCSAS